MAQDRDRCWAVVNAIMNLRFPYNVGYFLLAEEVLASHRGIRSLTFVSE